MLVPPSSFQDSTVWPLRTRAVKVRRGRRRFRRRRGAALKTVVALVYYPAYLAVFSWLPVIRRPSRRIQRRNSPLVTAR